VRLALVAPAEESIPPRTYGGIERVVHLLDRELTSRGHDVVLLASGGSQSAGRLAPLTDAPITAGGRNLDKRELTARKEAAARRAATLLGELQPDVVLNHAWRVLDHLHTPGFPVLTTVHYPLDAGPYRSIFLARAQWSFVSVSHSQQQAAEWLRFAGNVYNGVDLQTLPFSARADGYLAFLGRVSPDKGLDIAIRVAQAVSLPLKIAAKIDRTHQPWFEEVIAPLLRRGGAELIGEVDTRARAAFLGGAHALLHPSRWSEPFGMAAVEAMACGTPVLALRRGAACEVIAHGTTGFVVDSEDELAHAARNVGELERAACREHASRFSHTRMAAEYETLAQTAAA
jgi:glycosyltransferase involved in cell wall biosynthesis